MIMFQLANGYVWKMTDDNKTKRCPLNVSKLYVVMVLTTTQSSKMSIKYDGFSKTNICECILALEIKAGTMSCLFYCHYYYIIILLHL